MMPPVTPDDRPHRRRNPLTGEWVLVSPSRTRRPWLGQVEAPVREARPLHDPACYLCPRGTRAGGAVNPDYTSTFVFTNDFAALLPADLTPPDGPAPGPAPGDAGGGDDLFFVDAVSGECRVLCFSPRHDLTLADLPVAEIRTVVDLWATQTADLGTRYRWVQVFENKGAVMGASNPHPHGQIWASDTLPTQAALEDGHQRAYWLTHGRSLLFDYARREREAGTRVVVDHADWLVVVPFWAVWPFELLVLPTRTVSRLPDLTGPERDGLAEVLKRVLVAYDRLFDTAFPYSMGWHGAPFAGASPAVPDSDGRTHWQLHAHFYPPLLRSATVKKFMVGYEMLGEPQRDLTPEQAAARLRDCLATRG